MSRRFLVLSAGIILLAIVAIRWLAPREPVYSIPEGPQVMEGILLPVPLSLDRRGTHLLQSEGVDRAYVESTRVHLRDFEGLRVTVHGLLEANLDPAALPVLVASGVVLRAEPVRVWSVEPLHLTFESPIHWEGTSFDDGMRFTSAGSEMTVLMVYRAGLAALPAGTRMQVGGRSASLVSEAGSQTAYVQTGSGVIAFTFMDQAQETLSPEHLLLLRSVRFQDSARSSAQSLRSVPTVTGSGAVPLLPCGGPAGILCPPGSYCEITDAQEGIGQCRLL